MRWTVVVPGALLPSPIAADVLASAATPWLRDALARSHAESATIFETRGAPHLAWLWRQFGGAGEPVTAPYAMHALDAGADRSAQCWHVDPVHFVLARDHLLVAPLDDMPLADDEAEVLAQHVREALAEFAPAAAPRLHVQPGGWLLSLAQPWSLAATPLDGALGQSARDCWPEGDDARLWRKLLTEVQMRWHQEPLNEAREARGERAANALWLHGGGVWSALPRRPFATIASRDPVLRGWALAASVPEEALHGPDAIPAATGDAVSVWRGLLAPARFEAWGQWLQRLAEMEPGLQRLHSASREAGYDELALVLCGSRLVRIVVLRGSDRWRFWRRSTIAAAFVEAAEEPVA